MSRRTPKRHDALVHYVTAQLLARDLGAAVADDSLFAGYLRQGSVEEIAEMISLRPADVRTALHYEIVEARRAGRWPELASYMYDDETRTERRCCVCAAVLPRRDEKRGRTRKYCRPACKQRAYRQRGDVTLQPDRVRVSGQPYELGVDL
jgi:hypothetical protein